MTYPEDFLLKAMLLKEFPRDSVESVYNSAGSVRYEHESVLSAMGGAVVAALPCLEREVAVDESTRRIRHPDSMRQALLSALLPMSILFLGAPAVGDAQVPVVTNITSSGLGTEVPLELPLDGVYDITGGTRPGGGPNLFHSFGDFSVGPGDVANFLNTQVAGSLPLTSNIIGRVTGGNISNLYGTIRTTGFDVDGVPTNLFLVNPAGILFGPQGSFDVTGSVSFSTAQYLGLFDSLNEGSANFYADPASDVQANSVFTMAPLIDFGFLSPSAYGFLTQPDPSATITVQGSALSVLPGQSISLVGGNISIQADTLEDGTIQAASLLAAPSGQINLLSVASPGEVLVPSFQTGPNIDGASFTTMGTVTIKEGVTLDVSGQFDLDGNLIGNGNSGTVFVRGGKLVMDASTIQAGTMGAVDGAPTAVDIQVSQDVVLTNNSFISTSTSGPGKGGDVQLTADTLTMENDPFGIFTSTGGGGVGGDVVLHVREVSLMVASSIQSYNQNAEPGSGRGGNVTILGLPGAEFGAAESVTLSGDSSLSTTTFGLGEGGQVAITAKSLTMDGALTTVNASASDVGLGGSIDVGVHEAHLTNGATITTLTAGATASNAPTGGTITVHGLQGAISMADSVALSGSSSGIVSDTQGTGNSGAIAVYAKTISLTDEALTGGAVIQAGTPSTTGAGGAVTLIAASVDISGGSRIASQAREANAGQVTITADELTLNDGSIATNTSSSTGGTGGDVVLDVGTVSLSNGATINSSTASTGANAGNAGDVTITFSTTGNTLSLTSGSSITSSTTGAGDAGHVTVTTTALSLNDGTITTSTSSTGDAGGITATVGTLTLTNTAEISSSSTGAATGAAGSVTIQGLASPANSVTLTNSSLRTSADSTGRGGSITVDATDLMLIGSTISASVQDVNAADGTDSPTAGLGNVVLTSSTMNMTGGTVTAATTGTRNAGQVILTTPTLSLNAATITTSTSSTGDAGGITATAGTMNLTNGSIVSSNSTGTLSGAGDAGSVKIDASGSFTSNGSKVSTSAENATGGDILIGAQNVQLSNGTLISANSNAPFSETGEGNAGNITITSASNVVMQNSSVTTEASAASGGSIEILAADVAMIRLVNSRVSTSVGGDANVSNGGNITIDPQFVVLQNSQIRANANAGAGGAIDIIATSAFISDPLSIVNASSTLGISGTVNIQSPLQNVGEEVTPLSEEFSIAAALLAQQCAARAADGKFSTFVVAAREGLPMEPGGFLASPSLTPELLGPSLYLRDPQIQFSAVTGLFQKYDTKPIQLAKLGNACR